MGISLEAGAGSYGRCRTHRVALVPSAPESAAERHATERLAEEARERLVAAGQPVPVPPKRSRRRTSATGREVHCPACVQEVAAAAVARLVGR